jgi:hypothetical protein
MKVINTVVLLLVITLSVSCKKATETEPGGSTGQTRTITWEKILDFNELGEVAPIENFTISGNGKYIFYSSANRSIYRYNLDTRKKEQLYGGLSAMGTSYVHFIDGTLYTITVNANKSYFGISTDLGDNITQHYVATHVPFQAHGKFLYVNMNRLFKLPDGTLVLPDNAGNTDFALSTDGGLTWARKRTEVGFTFMPAHHKDRLFCLTGGWQGDFNIGGSEGLFYSDDMGDSWHKSDLKYAPIATDRQGNLISGSGKELQKLENGTWTLYQWDDTWPFSYGVRNFNSGGNIDQRHDDIEFDDANNLYLLSNKAIYKTKLN